MISVMLNRQLAAAVTQNGHTLKAAVGKFGVNISNFLLLEKLS